uniref:Integral membrane protein n=1 Tax=Mesocestoides corti TaxID=53468 RepID=A0A5K3FXM7_MESCO
MTSCVSGCTTFVTAATVLNHVQHLTRTDAINYRHYHQQLSFTVAVIGTGTLINLTILVPLTQWTEWLRHRKRHFDLSPSSADPPPSPHTTQTMTQPHGVWLSNKYFGVGDHGIYVTTSRGDLRHGAKSSQEVSARLSPGR